MSVQTSRGPMVPLQRRSEAFLASDWLAGQLGRDLRAGEAQVFGRIARDIYASTHAGIPPYTLRVGKKSSQRTAFLPEDVPMLRRALDHYRRTDTFALAEGGDR